MSSSTFSQTRSQALSLEKQTEQLLSKFSQFQQQQQQNQSQSLDITPEETIIRQQIEEIFQKRNAVILKLNCISEVEPNLSTSKLQQLTRHKEKLNDDNLSFTKIINNIEDERNKNNLLFNVHRDINHHKQQRNIDGNAYILEESERVNNVNSIADRLLQGAFATRDELLNQRQYLNNAQLQVLSTMQNIPGLNVLISKINTRRKRDTLILASVIAICILFLFFV